MQAWLQDKQTRGAETDPAENLIYIFSKDATVGALRYVQYAGSRRGEKKQLCALIFWPIRHRPKSPKVSKSPLKQIQFPLKRAE